MLVRQTEHNGRGVFSERRYVAGNLIEEAPYIEIPAKECRHIARTILQYYWYALGKNGAAIGLGNTSLYNHSNDPNASYELSDGLIRIYAVKTILRGDEITIHYGYQP